MQGSNDLGTKFRDLISVMAILGDSWKLDDEYAYKEVNKVLGCLLGDVIEVLEVLGYYLRFKNRKEKIFKCCDRDSRFTSRFWQSMQEALGTRLDMSTTYHPQTDGQSEHTIQNLEDMLRAYILDFGGSWDVHLSLDKVGEGQLIGPELVQETTEKISHIRDSLKVVRDRHKSYVDKRMKPLEFSVGDHVLLKVLPWKGVVRFGKKGKLAPRFVGPFEIIEKVGHVAYRLDLPEELNGVHDTFHVSNLKKCLADPTLEFKKLKRSRIAIVKVWWNSKRDPEFTWECEDQMKLKYSHLFSNVRS
ncbi:putative reverse transcriptase domain-containing protein [Tanacetum coccineum]